MARGVLPWHIDLMRTAIGLDWANRVLTSTSGKNFINRNIKITVVASNEVFEVDSLDLMDDIHKDLGWKAKQAMSKGKLRKQPFQSKPHKKFKWDEKTEVVSNFEEEVVEETIESER